MIQFHYPYKIFHIKSFAKLFFSHPQNHNFPFSYPYRVIHSFPLNTKMMMQSTKKWDDSIFSSNTSFPISSAQMKVVNFAICKKDHIVSIFSLSSTRNWWQTKPKSVTKHPDFLRKAPRGSIVQLFSGFVVFLWRWFFDVCYILW